LHVYPSDMAQNFWGAIWAWSTCSVVTIIISLLTTAPPLEQLRGLVYGLTPQPDEGALPWYKRPLPLGIAVAVLLVLLNVVFR